MESNDRAGPDPLGQLHEESRRAVHFRASSGNALGSVDADTHPFRSNRNGTQRGAGEPERSGAK